MSGPDEEPYEAPKAGRPVNFDPNSRFIDPEGYEHDTWTSWFSGNFPPESERNVEVEFLRSHVSENEARAFVEAYEEHFAKHRDPELAFRHGNSRTSIPF